MHNQHPTHPSTKKKNQLFAKWWSIQKSWQWSWNVCRMDKFYVMESYKQSSPLYNLVDVLCQSARCELWMCYCSWCFEQFTFKACVKQMYQVPVHVYGMDVLKHYVFWDEVKWNEIRAGKRKERRHKKWSALIKLNFAHIVVNACRSEKCVIK